jgi:methylmalonyl-CoA/ethylmalonyl-CoA epimerase
MKFHHIGYAVSNLKESLDIFLNLGYTKVSVTEKDEVRKVEIVFVENEGVLVELISPLDSNSPISNVLKKVGNSAYHICYEVEDIDTKIAELRKMRFIVVEKPSQAIAINNQRVAFLYNPKYGLLELLEKG